MNVAHYQRQNFITFYTFLFTFDLFKEEKESEIIVVTEVLLS